MSRFRAAGRHVRRNKGKYGAGAAGVAFGGAGFKYRKQLGGFGRKAGGFAMKHGRSGLRSLMRRGRGVGAAIAKKAGGLKGLAMKGLKRFK